MAQVVPIMLPMELYLNYNQFYGILFRTENPSGKVWINILSPTCYELNKLLILSYNQSKRWRNLCFCLNSDRFPHLALASTCYCCYGCTSCEAPYKHSRFRCLYHTVTKFHVMLWVIDWAVIVLNWDLTLYNDLCFLFTFHVSHHCGFIALQLSTFYPKSIYTCWSLYNTNSTKCDIQSNDAYLAHKW